MLITVDTSAIIAVLIDEPHKSTMIEITQGADLIAPASLPWEIGNAFSAMLKRKRVTNSQIQQIFKSFQQIPIRLVEVDLLGALELAGAESIYAYDAYMLICAKKYRTPILTLDSGLAHVAKSIGVTVMEVTN
jgi:predicted nucleic acid-binding protein